MTEEKQEETKQDDQRKPDPKPETETAPPDVSFRTFQMLSKHNLKRGQSVTIRVEGGKVVPNEWFGRQE